MKLGKVREILTQISKEPNLRLDNDEIDAIKIGDAAVGRIIACREPEGGSPLPPLAGETIE